MLKSRFLNVALIVITLAAFLYGIAQLFALRFEAGDIFPPYSTLRGDPLGAKVFYESLRALPDVAVERNERPLSRLGAEQDTTLFYLGTHSPFLRETEIQAFEGVASKGGRVVVSFHPQEKEDQRVSPSPTKSPAKNASPSPTPTPDESAEKLLDRDELGKRWKFAIRYSAELLDADAQNQIGSVLEPEVPWHSAIYFASIAEPWRVIYAVNGRAVIIEGKFGKGTIVLVSDSYFISNEAMLDDRKPALLAWLVGNGRRLVFDETHHKVFEDPGIASLVRKYRLHGLIIGLLLLTALFAWKSAASFLPRDRPEEASGGLVAGRDAYSGFTNLLRRGLRPGDLLGVCLAEWRKSFRHGAAKLDAKLAAFEAKPEEKLSTAELLRRYEEISRTLDKSKWKRTPTA
jgi:hypothetical protein